MDTGQKLFKFPIDKIYTLQAFEVLVSASQVSTFVWLVSLGFLVC